MAACRNIRIRAARARYSPLQQLKTDLASFMHGMMGKPPGLASDKRLAGPRVMLMLLVVMTGVAPISLYLLVPALPLLATTFSRDISIAQMTVSLYMVGIACSQIVMGPLSDRFGRRPVLLAGLALMVGASLAYDPSRGLARRGPAGGET